MLSFQTSVRNQADYKNTRAHRHTGYSETDKRRWRFLTLHLSAEKTCCPLKRNFLKQDTWTKLSCFFFLLCPPITACGALWKPWPGFLQALWQAWASSLFTSDKEGRGRRCFCLPRWEGRRRRWESREKESGMLAGKGEDVQQCGSEGVIVG